MKKRSNFLSHISPKGLSLILILFVVGATLILFTAGSSPHHTAPVLTITNTSSATFRATANPPNPQPELRVSDGIILAGSLLVLVIITGTIHATRGLKKPPHAD